MAWFGKLPWGDPSVAAQVLAMLLFVFGGVGGLINASYNLNLVVHNTAWIPGHLHLTVGTAVTLVVHGHHLLADPVLRGRALWSRRLALAQAWLWFVAMAVFSHAQHNLGLLGAPRRTMLGAAPYVRPEWQALMLGRDRRRGLFVRRPSLSAEPAPDGDGVARARAGGA